MKSEKDKQTIKDIARLYYEAIKNNQNLRKIEGTTN
jgi:hypothetical protein